MSKDWTDDDQFRVDGIVQLRPTDLEAATELRKSRGFHHFLALLRAEHDAELNRLTGSPENTDPNEYIRRTGYLNGLSYALEVLPGRFDRAISGRGSN